jgi:phosphoesterase RecJ-like protein
MSLSRAEQIQRLLAEKSNILITFRKDITGDAIASACALSLFLEELNKNVDVVVDDFTLPRKFRFLEPAEHIKSRPSDLQKFIINMDISERELEHISYETKDDELNIYLTPEEGMYEEDDIKSIRSEFKYDLIITVDTHSLSELGDMYEENTELFFNVPIVNIDCSNKNEHYGHINFIDITATSTVELIYNLITEIGAEYLTEELATALLTGLISKTQSFKSENVTPNTLEIAGKLMNLGADRDYIVDNLYRTRSLEELKLWGQALAHLESNADTGLVWTTITREDFVRAGAKEDDIKEIIEELIKTSPQAELILLLYEDPEDDGKVKGILSVDKIYNAKQLLKPFSPNGNKHQAYFKLDKPLKDAEQEVTKRINEIVSKKYS